MIEVRALVSFEHGGKRRPGEHFYATERQAAQLAAKGLVRPVQAKIENPRAAAGQKLSASPAAPVSPQTTAKPSKRGGRRKKAEVLL